jgi:hypothetical protein
VHRNHGNAHQQQALPGSMDRSRTSNISNSSHIAASKRNGQNRMPQKAQTHRCASVGYQQTAGGGIRVQEPCQRHAEPTIARTPLISAQRKPAAAEHWPTSAIMRSLSKSVCRKQPGE